MVATSGDRLIAQETVQILVRELFPRVTVVTPNLDEAQLLLGQAIANAQALDAAAQGLLAMGARAVLLKGGHLASDEVVDVLVQVQGPTRRLASTRIPSRNVHGTGCTLSSAIAAHLALGHGLEEAVVLARTFILSAIDQGAQVQTGQGHGPLNHGFSPLAMRRLAAADQA
jgi:hydroxymethylpyrimidine/phosphomethylpyrimidine kinase